MNGAERRREATRLKRRRATLAKLSDAHTQTLYGKPRGLLLVEFDQYINLVEVGA